jgi:copper oxidase (laccase) domain-containing protein
MTSTSVTTSSTSRRSFGSDGATLLRGTPVHARWTGVAEGDQRSIGEVPAPAVLPGDVAVRRLHQVHGAGIVVVDTPVPDGAVPWAPGLGGAPPDGDAVVASGHGFALAILTADCASVALGSPEGVHGAVHVGWRGLCAGVLPRTVDILRVLGATTIVAGLGPCIGPCCYEFSESDLEAHRTALGPEVRSVTTWGSPSLDLPAAVRGQLSRCGVPLEVDAEVCTMCSPGYFSHRGGGDEARQALLVWRHR